QRVAGLRLFGPAASALRLPPSRIPHRRFAERAGRLLGARLQLGLRARHGSNVLLRLGSLRRLGASIQLPRGDNDFLLRHDEIVDAIGAGCSERALTLSQSELLLVGPDLEKEHVAARFIGPGAPSEIARAHVIRNDVARLHLEILEKERVARGDERAAAL